MISEGAGWGLKLRAWVEKDGRKVLGPGRFELLGHIERHRSIAAAAKQMGMSYRRAWELVRDMNEASDEPLVELSTGGSGGGGAVLTPKGREAFKTYGRIVKALERTAAELLAEFAKDN